MTIETLDDVLGDGAYEDLLAFFGLFAEEYQPTCYQNKVDVLGESWRPDDGVHIAVYAEWPDGLFQIISFKGDKAYIGNGLCLDESVPMVTETCFRLCSKINIEPDTPAPFLNWLFSHGITEWSISLPSEYHDLFEALGFEIGESDESGMAMATAGTGPTSKNYHYAVWSREFKPEDRPSWTMGHAFIDALVEQHNPK